jgi:hypothetical protein
MKRYQTITLVFFILTLAISTEAGFALKSQALCLAFRSIPEIFERGTEVWQMLVATFWANPSFFGNPSNLLGFLN